MNQYLQKYSIHQPIFNESPNSNLGVAIVIPATSTDHIKTTLESLSGLNMTDCSCEVILMLYEADNKQSDELKDLVSQYPFKPDFKILSHCLSEQFTGKGNARKIGFDEAVRRFELAQKHDGIIVSLEEGCTVQPNLISEIIRHFEVDAKLQGASIYAELEEENILQELQHRYYINALRYSGLKSAFLTYNFNNCFRSSAYQQLMGIKKNATDMHQFIEKLIATNHYSDINSTTVYPCLISQEVVRFYNFQIFEDLKVLLENIVPLFKSGIKETLNRLPRPISAFFITKDKLKELELIKDTTNNKLSFERRFRIWFNGRLVYNLVNYMADNFYPDAPTGDQIKALAEKTGINFIYSNPSEALAYYRKFDKSGGFNSKTKGLDKKSSSFVNQKDKVLKYYKIYKPFGMLSQFKDGHGQATLAELFDFPKDVYPVGRLDSDSEGLLLLTNDKTINDKLLNPRNAHKRTYWSQVEGLINEEAIVKLENRITISIDGKEYQTRPAKARILPTPENLPDRVPPVRYRKEIPTSWVELELIEGKNRQVRRMTAKSGFPTLRLIRVSIENLKLGNMQPGEVTELSQDDFLRLLNLKR